MIEIAIILLSAVMLFQLVIVVRPSNILTKSIYLIFAAVTLCMIAFLAYHTIPNETDDLYRYFLEIERYKNRDIVWVISNGTWAVNIFSTLFLYLFALLGNKHLMPMILAISLYLISYCLLYKFENGKIRIFQLVVIEIFIAGFCELYYSLSVVRQTLAISVAMIIIYLDTMHKIKKNTVIVCLYLALPFFHSSLIVVTVICLLSHFIKSIKLAVVIEILSVVFVVPLMSLLSKIGLPIVKTILLKNDTYTFNGSYSMGTSSGVSIASIATIITLLLIAISAFKSNKVSNESLMDEQVSRKNYTKCFILLVTFLLIMYPFNNALFYRLLPLISVMGVPILSNRLRYFNSYSLMAIVVICGCSFIRLFFQYLNYFSNWTFNIS